MIFGIKNVPVTSKCREDLFGITYETKMLNRVIKKSRIGNVTAIGNYGILVDLNFPSHPILSQYRICAITYGVNIVIGCFCHWDSYEDYEDEECLSTPMISYEESKLIFDEWNKVYGSNT